MGKYSLRLYSLLLGVRATRAKREYGLKRLQKKLNNVKSSEKRYKIEHIIAYSYSFLEKFNKALELSNKHLLKNSKDLDALYNKMNIAMSRGNYKKMKKYEAKILLINPNAFKK